jgi:glycerophosphoryl diester phosphodiesterase
MAEAVKFRKMVDDVIISGCYKQHALDVKRNYPEFQILLNAAEDMAKLDEAEYDSYVRTTCHDAIIASCYGINMHYKDYREEMLYYARLRCLPMLIYTVDGKQEMEQFIRSGVHSITTHEVSTLVALKEQMKKS